MRSIFEARYCIKKYIETERKSSLASCKKLDQPNEPRDYDFQNDCSHYPSLSFPFNFFSNPQLHKYEK